MKYSVAGITLFATLFLSQGCSSTVKTEEKSGNQQTQVQSLPEKTSQTKQSESNSSTVNQQNPKQRSLTSSKLKNNSTAIQGNLTLPKKITLNKPVAVKIRIPNSVVKTDSNNNSSQPKQMYLVVVSNDLRFFDFVEGSYKSNQNIEVKPKFPTPGDYIVFTDYNPFGEKQQVFVDKVSIPGEVPFPQELESFTKTKILSDIKINLNLPQSNIKAGKKITLKFNLKPVGNNKPIQDLKPYLGQKANLVIIKSSSSLTESDYIDTETINNSPNNQLHFTTKFPQPGTYKLWLQFNRNDKIETADFWITVNS